MNFLSSYSYYIEIFLLMLILAFCLRPIGGYMAKVLNGEKNVLTHLMHFPEKWIYTFLGISWKDEMNWKQYAFALLLFSFCASFFVGLILYLQHFILDIKPLDPHLVFNIATSFVTNTNWQAYSPENDIHILFQVIALGVQQFISPSIGICILAVLMRGFASKNTSKIGNFWVDLTRILLYIMLPLASLCAFLFGILGVPQDWVKEIPVKMLESGDTQNYTIGPIASFVAIELLGSNGGGLFGANMAHPFQNPTPLTHFLGLFFMLLLPSSLCYTFGKMVNNTRQGWAIWAAMVLIFVPLTFFSPHQEIIHLNTNTQDTMQEMEGKETRIGINNSVLWALSTTATSNGSTASDHSSLSPLNSFMTMFLMQLSETIFGGVGSGLYTMLIFALVTVFIAGLMVGRTPEYLGKKIGPFEMKMVSLVLLMPLFLILSGAWMLLKLISIKDLSVNQSAQIFTEFIYNLSSTSNNNGSSMSGIKMTDSTSNLILGFLMLMGRFWVIIPILALAGSLAEKNTVPISSGTLQTHNSLFIFLLIGILLLVGVLTFIPALALGPIAEYLSPEILKLGGVK